MSLTKRLGCAVLMVVGIPVVLVWWLMLAVQIVGGRYTPYRDGMTFGLRHKDATP